MELLASPNSNSKNEKHTQAKVTQAVFMPSGDHKTTTLDISRSHRAYNHAGKAYYGKLHKNYISPALEPYHPAQVVSSKGIYSFNQNMSNKNTDPRARRSIGA